MLNLKVSVMACVWLAASVAAFGQASGNAYLFQVPAPGSSSNALLGYAANGNNFDNATINPPQGGPTETFQIIPKPDGSKFYLVGTNSVQKADASFGNFQTINGLSGAPTSAAMTPDGRYLLVGAGTAGNPCNLTKTACLWFIDTSTDQVIGNPLGLPGPVAPQYGIAITQDSRRAYVLTNPSFPSYVSAFDLTTRQDIKDSALAGGAARAITLSPLNLLYISAGNVIYEIDPATVTTTNGGQLGVVADPGPVRFTPDGTTGYFVNNNPSIGGVSIFKFTPATHSITTFSSNSVAFKDVYIAGNSRIFAWSPQTTSLYDVTPAPFGAAVSTSLPSSVSVTNVIGVAVSTELPSARYLFLLTRSGQQISLDRVDLTRNALDLAGSSTVNAFQPPPLVYVAVPPLSGASAFIKYNDLQTLTSVPATSLVLGALVLDSFGRPVYNQAVTFTTDSTNGAVINSPSGITNANGYVQTTVTVTAGTPTGSVNITLTAGAATTAFTLTVPNTGGAGGGGGGGGGPSPVTIVSGDGQLVYGVFAPAQPLVIKVTDTSGKPLVNTPVSFATASGNAIVGSPNVLTDSNGLASTFFNLGFQSNGLLSPQPSTVTASTPYGTVTFTETAVPSQTIIGFPVIQPEIDLDSPSSATGYSITIGAGAVIPNAVVARIYAQQPELGGNAAIPGVGLAIYSDPFNFTASPAGHCQGDPLSDQNGRVSCNLVGNCLAAGTVTPVAFEIGGLRGFSGTIITTAGTGSQIQKLAGDNQSGRANQQLQTPLSAIISDACGTPVVGAQVTWTVLQGSAVLTGPTQTSNSKGVVSSQVTFGQTPGPVQVKVVLNGGAQIVFTLTNQVVVSSINIGGGNNQTTFANQPFAQPLIVSVLDNNNNPVSGISVTFSVAAGSAAVSPSSPTTDAQGRASTTVTAGATAGTVTIVASYGTFSATFSLTVKPPGPVLTANAFLSAAFGAGSSGLPGLVPCGLNTVTGSGLAPNLQGVVSGISAFGPLPYTLNGVSITVNGVPAPIESVANQNGVQSINFQTPCEAQPGSATVVVTVNGNSASVSGVTIFAAAPGVFNYAGPGGKVYAAVIRAVDGSYVTPSNFARRGETYYIVVTGLGQVNPAAFTNSAGAGQSVLLPVIVGVNNAGVAVVSAQYLPGFIGAYIVGFQIPINAPSGADQPLAVAVVVNGELVFSNETLLAGVN